MMIRARVFGATVLFAGLLLDSACSSSSSPGGQAGDGESEAGGSGRTQAGASNRGGRGGAGGGGEAGAAGEAGSGATADSGGASGTSDGGTSDGGVGGDPARGPCAACASGFCTATGECVDCLPTNDHCPDGQYCSSTNKCISGCKDNSSCASGVCSAAHNCQSCISDQECSAPEVCGDMQCAAACSAAQEGTSDGCSTGLTCCGTHCVDAKTDSAHCGACGTACAAGQFCGVSGCADSTVAGVCSIAKITIVLDGQDGNAVPARTIAAGLKASCVPTPTVREVSQDMPDAVNATSGRPVAGGDELLIASGGSFFARLTSYVSTAPVAPIYGILNGDKLEFRKHATDEVVDSDPYAGAHTAEDKFVIQFMREPTSGSLILNAQGFWQAGTTAAAYYFVNVMLPNLATETKSWYVVKWVDGNANMLPDAGEFTPVMSGN